MDNITAHIVPNNRPNPQALQAVERFDGAGDADAWINSFNRLARLYDWPADVCLDVALIRLKGAAQYWANNKQFQGWPDFEQQCTNRFGETHETAIARYERCRQLAGESPKDFADRFLHDAARAGRVEDAALLHEFTNRLHPNLRLEVVRQRLDMLWNYIGFDGVGTAAATAAKRL